MLYNPLLVEKELELLKEELRALKECQTRYVGLAVTSTGIIFAYLLSGIKYVVQCNGTQYNEISSTFLSIDPVFLTPLIIILPVCCIFFDKATTISRVVGYYQILEGFSLKKYDLKKFIGWENSLSLLRENGRDREKKIKCVFAQINLWESLKYKCKVKYFLTFLGLCIENDQKRNELDIKKEGAACIYTKKSQMYLRLIYTTFLAISIFCFAIIMLPIVLCTNNENWIQEIFHINKITTLLTYILLILTFHTFAYNLKILYQLEMGFHSFKANRIYWETVLLKEKEEIDLHIDNFCFKKGSPLKRIIIYIMPLFHLLVVFLIAFELIPKLIPFIEHYYFLII